LRSGATPAIDRAAETRRAREVSRARGTPRTFDLNVEQGSFTTDYQVEPSVGVDAGAIVRLWHGLAAGVAFTSHTDDRDLAVDGFSVKQSVVTGITYDDTYPYDAASFAGADVELEEAKRHGRRRSAPALLSRMRCICVHSRKS
jgi:hypothetical protein